MATSKKTVVTPQTAPGLPRRKKVMDMSPAEMMPDWMVGGRRGTGKHADYYDTNIPSITMDNTLPWNVLGQWDPYPFNPVANEVRLNPIYTKESMEHTYPHEMGHNLWKNSPLPVEIQQQWRRIHKQALLKRESTPPVGVLTYPDDPGHSFADVYGEFVSAPERLRSTSPWIYNWMRTVMGREYVKRDMAEADSVASKVPFNWGTAFAKKERF